MAYMTWTSEQIIRHLIYSYSFLAMFQITYMVVNRICHTLFTARAPRMTLVADMMALENPNLMVYYT